MAVFINVLGYWLKLPSWYDFISKISSGDYFIFLKGIKLKGILWLFVIYPFLLGLTYESIKHLEGKLK